MNAKELWMDKCDAARVVKENFGTENALKYLIGEKFLDFLDAAERYAGYRAEISAFAAEIRDIFRQHEIAEYLGRARRREPFDLADHVEAEDLEMERQQDIREAARDLTLVEQARELLLGEE